MSAEMVTTPMTDAIEAHYAGLANDTLLITRCTACGRRQFPPRAVCYGCSSVGTLQWVSASGGAVVWSFVTYHKAYFPPDVRSVPYNVAIVELDEGPRLVTNLVDVPNGEVSVGLRVRSSFVHEADQHRVVFRPDPDSSAPAGAANPS